MLSIDILSEIAHLNALQNIAGLYKDLLTVKEAELKKLCLTLEMSSGYLIGRYFQVPVNWLCILNRFFEYKSLIKISL